MVGEVVTTPHTNTPGQAAQAQEAAAREAPGGAPQIDRASEARAAETVGDLPAPQPIAKAPNAQPAAPQPVMPTVRTMGDDKRAAILSRFRQDRGVEATADNPDEVIGRAGLPPEFAAQPEPQLRDPETGRFVGQEAAGEEDSTDTGVIEAQPAPQPQTIKLKVHGKEIELPIEEVIGKAQIALASDEMFDTAKSRLKEVDALLADTRNKVARGDQPGAHQPGQQPAQPGTLPAAPAPGTPTEDPFGKLIETIQFGDPDEAKQLLGQTIRTAAAQETQAQLQQARFRDEGARAAKTVKDFEAAHPDIAQDPMAVAAIEQNVYAQQLTDLKNIGIDPNTIRGDGMPPTPGDISNAHRWFRVEQGMTSLKTPQQMLESAHDSFLDWKGIKKANPATPAPNTPAQKATPVVDLTIDRSARRQAIPQQPSAVATTRPSPAQPAPAPRDRGSIVQAMKNRNAKLRGTVLVAE
jgi:hypothetical protein